MDCLVPEPRALPAYAATCVAAAGSGLARNSLYLPRLSSIPEAAEHSMAVADGGDLIVEALLLGQQPGSSSTSSAKATAADHQQQWAQDNSQCSRTDKPLCCQHDQPPCSCAAEAEAKPNPDVLASSWAISIRHFTDCVPLTADSVCSNSTCHALSLPGSGEVGSSSCPPATDTQHQQHQQQGSSAQGPAGPAHVALPQQGSSSSQVIAADRDDGAAAAAAAVSGSGASMLGAAGLQGLNTLEWSPRDRVADWLGTQQVAGTAAPAAASAAASASAAAVGTMDGACGAAAALSAGRSLQDTCSSGEGDSSGSDADRGNCQGRQQRSKQRRTRQPQQQEQGALEAQWDAPQWWQESVEARLEEQREAFHSSWWCRFKILTGLAAQRAACAL